MRSAKSTTRRITEPASQTALLERSQALLERAQALAEELAGRPNLGLVTAPLRALERCAAIGLMTAPLPVAMGGLGLGTRPGTQRTLMRLLSVVGSADLALGRIYEGHVNGILLVQRYGSAEQMRRLARDFADGMLSGVWNTGQPRLMHLEEEADGFRLVGAKTFATGAEFVKRPIVTAEIPGRGWQMTMPQMERLDVSFDRSFWHPLGMESSESFGVDFTGCLVGRDDLIGSPGDFYRDPMFRGGAIRFAAVQAGAILRLHFLYAEWLDEMQRGEDPYQIARLGEVSIAAQEAVLWVEKASAVAEESFFRTEKEHLERMIECANMTRTAIERLATRVMQIVVAGVGAHGLLQPHRFERVIRDLTMYLRQPAPDQTLASVGRLALEKAHTSARLVRRVVSGAMTPWSSRCPPRYFERIYARKDDPWGFETSEYERRKYEQTLLHLPKTRYTRGLEVGCSIGVLTRLLAERCDRLVGVDVSEQALERARLRCAGMVHVEFRCMHMPAEMPDGLFDLIILSEVGLLLGTRRSGACRGEACRAPCAGRTLGAGPPHRTGAGLSADR